MPTGLPCFFRILPWWSSSADVFGERVPAAIPLSEVVDHVCQIDELALEEEGVGVGDEYQVVARLRLSFGRALRRQLEMRDRVDAHGDAGLLAEHLRLPAQLVVGGGHEVVPGEEGQLALLRERGSLAEREPGRHAGGRASALLEKL